MSSRSSGFAPDLMHSRVALVTGAAGGIGSAVCDLLLATGATVIAVDRDAPRLRELVRRLDDPDHRLTAVVADPTTDAGVAELATTAAGRGPVDVLVNGVGDFLGVVSPFEDSDPADWPRLYEVNLGHVLRTCHAFVPAMKAAGWGGS
jgi:3-oxoacyl-[acyl-carrier protein] reductase